MKKLISVILALVLCVSVASALAANSPTVDYDIDTNATDKFTVDPDTAAAADLTNKLLATVDENGKVDVDAFFGDVILPDGSTATVSDILGTEDLDVNEFVSLKHEGQTEEDVTVVVSVPAVYKAGTKVIIVIGVIDGDNVTWYAFPGEVAKDGTVEVTLTAELLKAMEGKDSVIGVVNAKD